MHIQSPPTPRTPHATPPLKLNYRASQPRDKKERALETFRSDAMSALETIADKLKALDNTEMDSNYARGSIATRDGSVTFDSKSGQIQSFQAKVGRQTVQFERQATWFGLGSSQEILSVHSGNTAQSSSQQLYFEKTGDKVQLIKGRSSDYDRKTQATDFEPLDPLGFLIAPIHVDISHL